jgi:hypothetical protein
VVGIGGRDNGVSWVKVKERSVEFIGLNHHQIWIPGDVIGSEIGGNSAQESRERNSLRVQQLTY